MEDLRVVIVFVGFVGEVLKVWITFWWVAMD